MEDRAGMILQSLLNPRLTPMQPAFLLLIIIIPIELILFKTAVIISKMIQRQD